LETEISWNNDTGDKKVILTKAKRKTRITARVTLKAPIETLLKKLITRKFAKWNDNGTKIR